MKTYRVSRAPIRPSQNQEVRDLTNFVQGEFQAVAQAAQRADPSVSLQYLREEPSRISAGDVVLADGTDWDPGSGAGMYRRDEDNAAWEAIGGGGGLTLASLLTGYAAGSNTPITALDSILSAFENLQAQISAGGGGGADILEMQVFS